MKPKKSLSFGSPAKGKVASSQKDADTDELPPSQVFPFSESVSTSPNLWRRDWSTPSSFASSLNPRDTAEDESAPYLPASSRPTLSLRLEGDAILRIKQESEDTKDYLRGLARHLQIRANEVRSNSSLNTMETKAMKDYLHRLGGRLDGLLEESASTEKMLESMLVEDTLALRRTSTTDGRVEQRIQQLEAAAAGIARAKRGECRMEGAEKRGTRCLFC